MNAMCGGRDREIFLLLLLLLPSVSFTPLTDSKRLLWSPSDGAVSYIVRSRPANSLNYVEFPPQPDTTFALLQSDIGRFFSVSAVNSRGKRSQFSNEVQYTITTTVMEWPADRVLRFKLHYVARGQNVHLEWRQTNLGVDTGWRELVSGVDFYVSNDIITLDMTRVANSETTGGFTNTQSFRARLSYGGVSGNYAYPPNDFKFVEPVPLDIERIEVLL